MFCWPALTEGHGSCTLSVWTLAEPLGVLFQARSDNLAPATRLATAQFTGRSSAQATPSPHLSSQLLLSLLSFPLSSPCTLLHLSIPPSLLSQLSQYLLPCCYLTQTFRLAFLFLSISMTPLSAEEKGKASVPQTRGPASLPTATDCFFNPTTSWSGLFNQLLWRQETSKNSRFESNKNSRQESKTLQIRGWSVSRTYSHMCSLQATSWDEPMPTVSWVRFTGNHF